MILYHGSHETVEFPEIRKARFHKDFYFGFYRRGPLEQVYLTLLLLNEGWILSWLAEVDIPIPMILWKVLWRMTRFIIIFRISWMGEYQERLFGSW